VRASPARQVVVVSRSQAISPLAAPVAPPRAGMSQMGGLCAYRGRLRKGRCPGRSRHSAASAKQASRRRKWKRLAVIAHRPFREATERAAQFRRQHMLSVRPCPRLARCDGGYWFTTLHSGTTSNGAPRASPLKQPARHPRAQTFIPPAFSFKLKVPDDDQGSAEILRVNSATMFEPVAMPNSGYTVVGPLAAKPI
jgi:hypothetical protein